MTKYREERVSSQEITEMIMKEIQVLKEKHR